MCLYSWQHDVGTGMAYVEYNWWKGPVAPPPEYISYYDTQEMKYMTITYLPEATGGTMNGDCDDDDDIVLETADLLNDEIDTVDEVDSLREELATEDTILDAEAREIDRLQNELAAKNDKAEIKRDWLGRPKVDETTYKNHLDIPVQQNVFEVHGKTFHSFNEALQFEVLTDLKNKTFAFDRYGFEDHAIEAEDNKPNSVESLGEFCIPLDCLAQNIDEISLILREYQQKKQR
jgi:hypothetical protein